jgi:nucleoside-diphosphate-sugar epimerase
MKVLVTGATGFLGGSVVDRLLARGERDVRCLVRSAGKAARLEAVVKKHGVKVEMMSGTIASVEGAAAAIDGCDVIYHLAASLSGAPADMFLNTVVTTRNLLDAMVAKTNGKKPKLVHVSSFGVYGVAEQPRGATVDEHMPLEAHPERRDTYSHAKLRQEQLVWEYSRKHDLPVVVLRPGVIYGPAGGAFSARVGLSLFGIFLHLGGGNLLPLTYVDNCADAIVLAGQNPKAVGEVYNVVDDELITSAEYLALYKKNVKPLASLRLPYPALAALSSAVKRYHDWSKGQLPAIFTPYKAKTTWGGNRFDNTKLKGLGWRPIVSTSEGLARTFDDLKAREARA